MEFSIPHKNRHQECFTIKLIMKIILHNIILLESANLSDTKHQDKNPKKTMKVVVLLTEVDNFRLKL